MAEINKVDFEIRLLRALGLNFQFPKGIKISKKLSISYKVNHGIVDISLQYVKSNNGYYLIALADNTELTKFIDDIGPPYKSRLRSKQLYCHTTLSERGRLFGDSSSGYISIPSNEKWMDDVANSVSKKIKDTYFDVACNFARMNINLMDDIRKSPDDYAYPFLSALFAAKVNGMKFNEFPFEKFRAEKILGNLNFDLELAKETLN